METSYIRKEIDYNHAMEIYTLGTILLLLCKKLQVNQQIGHLTLFK